MNRVRSLLSMRGMLLGHSFDLRPNSRAFGIAGSVMTSSLLINECLQLKNQFDEGKRD